MTEAKLFHEPARRRLVRFCAAVSGDSGAAEDLAQETLLEAWRNRHKLHDPTGADRWLAAIARNVCRRWARERGRTVALLGETAIAAADDPDPDQELDRAELVELVGRALAHLPPETRRVLVEHYANDAPHAEIGARLGLSEDAVSMRLTRGRRVLRRVLESELRAETDGDWVETRVWCAHCGRRRLSMRREPPPGALSFWCLGCNQAGPGSEFPLGNPVFARLVGDRIRPTAILARAAEWVRGYFAAGAGREVACTRCGRPVALRRFVRNGSPGLFADCPACSEQVAASAHGLAHALDEMRLFTRDHPRTHLLADREVDRSGQPTLVVSYRDLFGHAGLDVVFARETLRVLEVHSVTG